MNLGKFQKKLNDIYQDEKEITAAEMLVAAKEIIEELERALDTKSEILFAYRTGGRLREKTFRGIERFERYGIE